MNRNILLFIFLFSVISSHCQMYNYNVFNHYDFETNPSYIARGNYNANFDLSYSQQSDFKADYITSKLLISKYFKDIFSGTGIILSTNKINNNVHYNYFGLSAAYRNIIFDKAHLRIGATYKYNNTTSTDGIFEGYNFISTNNKLLTQNIQSLNFSFSVSSPNDALYSSFGISNFQINNFMDSSLFPVHYFANFGNLLNLINKSQKSSSLNITIFTNSYKNAVYENLSYYLTFYSSIKLSRKSSFKFGIGSGVNSNKFYEIMPFVSYIKSVYSLQLMYDNTVNVSNYKKTYNPFFKLNFQIIIR